MAVPNILIIEDDAASMRLYVRVLNKAEYNVYQAVNLQEARDLLDNHHFSLILCDMELGAERSLELLKDVAVTLKGAGTGIVAVSAQEQYRQVCEMIGVEFFLSKPVSVSALVKLIDRITVGRFDRTVPLILDTREMMRINLDD